MLICRGRASSLTQRGGEETRREREQGRKEGGKEGERQSDKTWMDVFFLSGKRNERRKEEMQVLSLFTFTFLLSFTCLCSLASLHPSFLPFLLICLFSFTYFTTFHPLLLPSNLSFHVTSSSDLNSLPSLPPDVSLHPSSHSSLLPSMLP